MPITRQEKEDILVELKDKFSRAQSVAFGQYAGISMEKMTQMRKKMRESNVEFKVAKKTLLKLAAKEQGVDLPDDIMEGTVGAVFSYNDPVSGPKIFKSFIKEVEVLKLLGGMMDGAVLSTSQMKSLADLPSKDELLAKFMMMMKAPLQQFYGSLSAPLASFARASQASADKKTE